MDGSTGDLILAEHELAPWEPASLTKMMTLYLLFEALDRGPISLHDTVAVSERAAAQRGSRLGLTVGQHLTLHEAINGLIVVSGNDVAVAVAEYVGSTLEEFVRRMNEQARDLKLQDTTFVNASGRSSPGQITNALAMARLGFRLYTDFPGYRPWLAQASTLFDGQWRQSTNSLLTKYPGMDGIKTGTLRLRHLVASAGRDERRLIAVVMGCRNHEHRDAEMTRLLNCGFAGISPFAAVS
jgi:D-alanyl-D-alanine carboxypeptidase